MPSIRAFATEIEDQLRAHTRHRLRGTIRFVESTRPGELAQLIASMSGKVHAVAATGLDHHEVTRAVADLRARGIPTFSLLSDYAQGVRESYVGLNNLKVGRAVGWLMSRIARRPGQGCDVCRRTPLPRPRTAGDGPAQLLPRVRP